MTQYGRFIKYQRFIRPRAQINYIIKTISINQNYMCQLHNKKNTQESNHPWLKPPMTQNHPWPKSPMTQITHVSKQPMLKQHIHTYMIKSPNSIKIKIKLPKTRIILKSSQNTKTQTSQNSNNLKFKPFYSIYKLSKVHHNDFHPKLKLQSTTEFFKIYVTHYSSFIILP